MKNTNIHLIRHGAVENPNNIYYGRLPRYGLSDEGQKQARSTGILLMDQAPISAVYSSPLLRARQTAEILVKDMNLYISYTRLLLESFTPYDGRPGKELEEKRWDIYTGNHKPYELPKDVFDRSYRFIDKVLRKHSGSNVIAVTHADIILFLSLWACGYPVDYHHKAMVERHELPITFPANASITTLSWNGSSKLPEYSYIQN